MKITEIAYVVYPVIDVKRASVFYEEVLGLKPEVVFEQDGMAFIEYWIGKGGEHCLVIGAGAPMFKPGKTGATAALEVDDFDGYVSRLKEASAPFVMEAYDTPACRMALVEDPDGNQIMIHQRKKK